MSDEAVRLKDENWKLKRQNDRLRSFLLDLFDKLRFCLGGAWVVSYLGAVAWAWYWLNDKHLAVAITLSLAAAHSAVGLNAYLKRKRKELTES